MRKGATSPIGSAIRTACAAIAVSAILPTLTVAQDCVPMSDPALRAATEAQRAGHPKDATKILWDARQATEQSAPDSPKMALYLRRTAGMNGTDAIADLRRAMEIGRAHV